MKKFLLFLTFTLTPLVAYPFASSMVYPSACPGGCCVPPRSNSSVAYAGSLFQRGSASASRSDFRTEPATPHPAVVRIVVENAKSQNYGTGTWIRLSSSRCAVLTCAHLFETETPVKIAVYFPNHIAFNAQIQAIDRTWDVALLQTATGNTLSSTSVGDFPSPVTLTKEPPRQGDYLRMCGYGPHGRCLWVLGKTRGYSHLTTVSETHTLVASGVARQGDSGAPILTLDGALAGVLWGTDGSSIYGTWSGKILQIFAVAFRESVEEIPEKPIMEERSTMQINAQKPFSTIRNRISAHRPPRLTRPLRLPPSPESASNTLNTENDKKVEKKTVMEPETREVTESDSTRKRLFRQLSDSPVRPGNVVKNGIWNMIAPHIYTIVTLFILVWLVPLVVIFVILWRQSRS